MLEIYNYVQPASQCTYASWETYQITFGIIIPLSLASTEGSSTSESVIMFSLWYLYENIYEQIHCSRHLGFPMQNLLQSIQLPKIFSDSVSEAYPYLICSPFWSKNSSRRDIHWRFFAPDTLFIPSHTTLWTIWCKNFFRCFWRSFQPFLLLGVEFKPHIS